VGGLAVIRKVARDALFATLFHRKQLTAFIILVSVGFGFAPRFETGILIL
jgi:hypothetical protein